MHCSAEINEVSDGLMTFMTRLTGLIPCKGVLRIEKSSRNNEQTIRDIIDFLVR